ncbi:hypothetical protein [Nocardia sp. NPDC005998]
MRQPGKQFRDGSGIVSVDGAAFLCGTWTMEQMRWETISVPRTV